MSDGSSGAVERDKRAEARAAMVARQLRARGIADERVLLAMNQVPREEFVRRSERDLAYADEALPIEAGQTISQPYMVARMTELLAPRAGDRVLEIGTGSGYQAAILAMLGAAVLTIERQPELAALARERLARLGLGGAVEVRIGDGSVGDAGGRAVGRDHRDRRRAVDPRLAPRAAVADGGRLVIPVGDRHRQDLLLVRRHGDEWLETNDGPCVFVPLVGAEGFPG